MKFHRFIVASGLAIFLALGTSARAQNPNTTGSSARLEEVVVQGRAEDLLGVATTASEGAVGAVDLRDRPILRRGELLETVPGLVITQHSGDGKANQYFLRGFNLDHGSDLALSIDGMPINLRTHAHGQGYSDLNFIIPELVERIDFQKGPFYPEIGDFSGAGAAQFHLMGTLANGILKQEIGEHGYTRTLLADTLKLGIGQLTAAFEFTHYDGPWTHAENSNRYNGFLRYVWGEGEDHFALTAMSYHADWNSTDQVAKRAIDRGLISRWDALDPSDGGASDRDSLSFDWTRTGLATVTRLNLYAIYYRLNLFSNFTYFLDDPVHGDQFEQIDKRVILGGALTQSRESQWWGHRVENLIGMQVRNDLIPEVGINYTEQRTVLGVVRKDRVEEFSVGLFAKNTIHWTDWMRSEIGLRGDVYYFDVNSNIDANSGTRWAGIASPKLSLIFGPWQKTELYFDIGTGFHSNDARGVTIQRDPSSGEHIGSSSPLVRTRGAETGVRTSILDGLTSTLSFWYLESDGELVFSGDSGGTEAAGATRRYGIEWANFYKPAPLPWLTLDADFAFTHARFIDNPAGSRIPNSLSTVITAGATVETPCGIFGALRMRYFGPQPLIEDNSAIGPSSLLFDARIGYRWKNWEFALDCLNIADARVNDIEYFYTSRLPGEPAGGVDDFHLHPAEPRQLRVSITAKF